MYHTTTSNNCNNAVPVVFPLYCDTTGVAIVEEPGYITQFPPSIIN